MKKLLPFLSMLLALQSYGQYQAVDDYVKSLRLKKKISVQEAAEAIIEKSTTGREKARAIFTWLAENVEYDVNAIRTGRSPKSDPAFVLEKRIAVCQGFSGLFQALAKEAGIQSIVVSGFSKGFGYENRKKLEFSDHAWNIVNIEGDWYLIDATWGAGHMNQYGKYVAKMNERYFLSKPEKFIAKHLPEDPIFQLLPCPVTPNEFLKDSSKVIAAAKNKEKCMSYRDSIKNYLAMDSVRRMVTSARRIHVYFPGNSFTPAMLLNNAAHTYSRELNNKQVTVERKMELAKKALRLYREAENMLSGNGSQHVKGLKKMLKLNIENIENFIQFYEKN